MNKRRAGDQMELLGWEPPHASVAFEPALVRAHGVRESLCRAIAAALKDAASAGLSRADIAGAMGEFLGATISKAMLDAYASQAREGHTISLTRFVALLHATGDRRLLELLAEPLGWTVIERRYLPMIELAAVQARQDELRHIAEGLRRRARAEGAL